MRIAGGSEMTAIYAGINAKQKAFFAMLIGGGFAGLAGGVELLSPVSYTHLTLPTNREV